MGPADGCGPDFSTPSRFLACSAPAAALRRSVPRIVSVVAFVADFL